MKKLLPFFTLLLLYSAKLLPQAPVSMPEEGKISPEELASRECPFEKGAAAYYLLNYSKVSFSLYYDGSHKVVTQRRVRIKLIDQKGYDAASISIPHAGSQLDSKITSIQAFIYTTGSNGAVIKTKVERKDIFKTATGSKNNLNLVRFTFPGLSPGCVLEYSYEHIEKDNYDIDPWLFQYEIPVALSYCELNYPNSSLVDFRLAGGVSSTDDNYQEWPVDSQKTTSKKIFQMKNVPSFRAEPMMTSMLDNIKRVEFYHNPNPGMLSRLPKTKDGQWTQINTMLNFSLQLGGQLTTTLEGTEKLEDSVKALKNNRDKIKAVYDFVKKQMTWNKHQRIQPGGDIKTVWQKKTGNSTDLNLILLNLLQKTGVTCFPVLFSTREHGKPDPNSAHLDQFNGLDIIAMDTADYFVLDATQKEHSFLIPPLNVVNRDVLAIMPGTYKWININESRYLIRDSVHVSAVMDKTGMIKGEAVSSAWDISREMLLAKDKETDKKDTDKNLKEPTDISVDSSWTINGSNENSPLNSHALFHLAVSVTGDFYFLNPSLFDRLHKNPFKDSTRLSEIDFICNQQFKQVIQLIVPPEIQMETLPKNILIRTVDTSMTYSRKIIQQGSRVQVENEFTINRAIFSPDEYPTVSGFFNRVYGLLAEELVLRRKTD